jgi:hypothetical protein
MGDTFLLEMTTFHSFAQVTAFVGDSILEATEKRRAAPVGQGRKPFGSQLSQENLNLSPM